MMTYKNEWTLDYTSYVPDKEKHTEALCAIGNGYLGNRGAFEESQSSDYHYPATYIAGLYNRRTSKIAGRDIENEDFVNCPNWTYINFKINDEPWFSLDDVEIISYHKQLNTYEGMLTREIMFKDQKGRISKLHTIRFASMDNPHLAAIRFSITAENYSGTITFRSALDGDIINEGVDRYKQLNSLHLAPVSESIDNNITTLIVETNQSKIKVAQSAYNKLFKNNEPLTAEGTITTKERYICQEYSADIAEKEQLTLEKIVSIYTSKSWDSATPSQESIRTISTLIEANSPFSQLLPAHKKAWEKIWDAIKIELDGDDTTQHIIRLHSYHLIVSASPHNTTIDASVPARGLHGEAYRGHIFWDDMFIMPFYEMHFPEVARSLIMYRYRRIDKAREYAEEYGYKGAMFPWQSGSDGREETQIIHLNPVSGEWGDDYSSLQRHVSLAIAYDVWMYYWKSKDLEFLRDYGAEMLFEIARFWDSKCELNTTTGRYEINKIMGPNEYHEKHPENEQGGLKDNAYTNIMTVWLFKKCFETMKALKPEELKKITDKIALSETETTRWKDITTKINLVIKDGIISQYDGFFKLKELDWENYRKKHKNIGRMDRILKAENLSPDDYQLSKQADILMLFYILPLQEIEEIITQLGFQFDETTLPKNYKYYLERTSHGSTLSLIVHAQVGALLNDMETSFEWFEKSLQADVNDIQGGTTKEGIHAGLMAGTINLLITSYAGLDLHSNLISLNPKLPANWKRLKFKADFRNNRYTFEIFPGKVVIELQSDNESSASINLAGKSVSLTNNQRVELTY